MTDEQADQASLHLRLYVVGAARNSIAAIRNLNAILSGQRPESFVLEIVDCVREPGRALAEGVLVTPTLVRVRPEPQRTIVGSLSELEQVASALGLEVRPARPATNE